MNYVLQSFPLGQKTLYCLSIILKQIERIKPQKHTKESKNTTRCAEQDGPAPTFVLAHNLNLQGRMTSFFYPILTTTIQLMNHVFQRFKKYVLPFKIPVFVPTNKLKSSLYAMFTQSAVNHVVMCDVTAWTF